MRVPFTDVIEAHSPIRGKPLDEAFYPALERVRSCLRVRRWLRRICYGDNAVSNAFADQDTTSFIWVSLARHLAHAFGDLRWHCDTWITVAVYEYYATHERLTRLLFQKRGSEAPSWFSFR